MSFLHKRFLFATLPTCLMLCGLSSLVLATAHAQTAAPAGKAAAKPAAKPQPAAAPEAGQEEKMDPVIEAKVQAAVKVAAEWLGRLDKGEYDATHDGLIKQLRDSINRPQWAERMKGMVGKLGTRIDRVPVDADYTTSLPGAPKGEYVIIIGQGKYSNYESVREEILLTREGNTWKIAGYRPMIPNPNETGAAPQQPPAPAPAPAAPKAVAPASAAAPKAASAVPAAPVAVAPAPAPKPAAPPADPATFYNYTAKYECSRERVVTVNYVKDARGTLAVIEFGGAKNTIGTSTPDAAVGSGMLYALPVAGVASPYRWSVKDKKGMLTDTDDRPLAFNCESETAEPSSRKK